MSEFRKRSRSFSNYDDDKHVYEKRARIDELLQNLTLDKDSGEISLRSGASPNPLKSEISTKPLDTQYEVFAADSLPIPSFDHYISNKLYEHCQNMTRANLLLIRPYNPRFLVLYNVQKWAVRMFNRFILKYNQNHNARVAPVKNCSTILEWVKNGVLSLDSLNLILTQENKLSMMEVAQRRLAKDEQRIEELEREFSGIKYNYWDNIGLSCDEEMLPVDNEPYEIMNDTDPYGQSQNNNCMDYDMVDD